MSKKYKGKTCVYCGIDGISNTRDHVLAREFVLERHRGNLPAVPACKSCNNEKSKLETSLTGLLPFAAQHEDALENLRTMLPKRLRANTHLRSQVASGLNPIWLPAPSGIWQRTGTLPIDAEDINKWVSLVVTGLIWHHWRTVVAAKTSIEPSLPVGEGEDEFRLLFKARRSRHVPATSIGGDALI